MATFTGPRNLKKKLHECFIKNCNAVRFNAKIFLASIFCKIMLCALLALCDSRHGKSYEHVKRKIYFDKIYALLESSKFIKQSKVSSQATIL